METAVYFYGAISQKLSSSYSPPREPEISDTSLNGAEKFFS
jgi:hypothetical protein